MIVVIVPVLGRPANAAPLAESIAANTTVPYRLVWVVSGYDEPQARACAEAGGTVRVSEFYPQKGDFARKINEAYLDTDEPWIFQGADDIVFHPGWDTAAIETAERTGARVVGTNDGHNPTVKAGLHSTHTFIHRSYVDDPGASLDGPGTVFSEAYGHQYCDTELVELAKARGEWAFSAGSLVEHRHPFWVGRDRMDDTYRKGLATSRQDSLLYRRRMRNVVRVSQR